MVAYSGPKPDLSRFRPEVVSTQSRADGRGFGPTPCPILERAEREVQKQTAQRAFGRSKSKFVLRGSSTLGLVTISDRKHGSHVFQAEAVTSHDFCLRP